MAAISTDNGSTFVSTAGAYYWGGRYRTVGASSASAGNRGIAGGAAQIVIAEVVGGSTLLSFDYSLHNVKSSSQRFHTHGLFTTSAADYIVQGGNSGMYDTDATITDIRILLTLAHLKVELSGFMGLNEEIQKRYSY